MTGSRLAKPDKEDAIAALTFGERVAELEKDALAAYFVETDQWRKVESGSVDVIFGAKGSGKSAIYTSMMHHSKKFEERGISLVSAERPQGTTVFQGLVAEPPTSEAQFQTMWKAYILSLIGSEISTRSLAGDAANRVRDALVSAGLLDPSEASLGYKFQAVWEWVKKRFVNGIPEAEASLDPVSGQSSLTFRIVPERPSLDQRRQGYRSLDDLLELANQALEENSLSVWLLFDRLDVAFADSRTLEANGIRSLFKAYLDLSSNSRIRLKIFLRTDIWDEVSSSGFREASHITKQLRISWDSGSLLNLVVRRAVKNEEVVNFYGLDVAHILSNSNAQRTFFDSMVPEKIDVGKNPYTFEWVLGRVQDGSRKPAPREVIHLLNEARDAQLRMIDRGDVLPPGEELLSRSAFKEALKPVSQVRLEQTVFAEYPEEKPWIQALEGGKSEHTEGSLAILWEVRDSEALKRATRLIEIGVLEERTSGGRTTYWVPFLYRPGLDLRQGAASGEDADG